MCACSCVCVGVCVCMRACVCACLCVCVHAIVQYTCYRAIMCVWCAASDASSYYIGIHALVFVHLD